LLSFVRACSTSPEAARQSCVKTRAAEVRIDAEQA